MRREASTQTSYVEGGREGKQAVKQASQNKKWEGARGRHVYFLIIYVPQASSRVPPYP